MKFSAAIARSLSRWRRMSCEAAGISRYSRLGLNGLDRKLERHLNFDGGVFVEAGANDGLSQSNTYFLERFRNWTGLLVEPVPSLAAECRKNRRGPVAEAALVAQEIPDAFVELHGAGLMSTVAGAMGDADATARHVAAGLVVQQLPRQPPLRVRARTLSALLDEAGITRTIDLLSLDVEGAELMALRGLDFRRHAPRFLCVEARDEAGLAALLGSRYRLCEVLTELGTHRDLLYALK